MADGIQVVTLQQDTQRLASLVVEKYLEDGIKSTDESTEEIESVENVEHLRALKEIKEHRFSLKESVGSDSFFTQEKEKKTSSLPIAEAHCQEQSRAEHCLQYYIDNKSASEMPVRHLSWSLEAIDDYLLQFAIGPLPAEMLPSDMPSFSKPSSVYLVPRNVGNGYNAFILAVVSPTGKKYLVSFKH